MSISHQYYATLRDPNSKYQSLYGTATSHPIDPADYTMSASFVESDQDPVMCNVVVTVFTNGTLRIDYIGAISYYATTFYM